MWWNCDLQTHVNARTLARTHAIHIVRYCCVCCVETVTMFNDDFIEHWYVEDGISTHTLTTGRQAGRQECNTKCINESTNWHHTHTDGIKYTHSCQISNWLTHKYTWHFVATDLILASIIIIIIVVAIVIVWIRLFQYSFARSDAHTWRISLSSSRPLACIQHAHTHTLLLVSKCVSFL